MVRNAREIAITHASSNQPSQEQLAGLDEGLDRTAATVKRELPLFTHGLEELWEQATPPNWHGLDPATLEAAIQFAIETGWSVVWVPSADVIRALVAAKPAAREAVLASNSDGIAADMEHLLEEISEPDLADLKPFALDAVETFRSGHAPAAQALATTVMTTAIHDFVAEGFAAAREVFEEADLKTVGVEWVRLVVVHRTMLVAMSPWWDEGEPVPVKYNRHTTTHRVSATQYTELNALAALMLMTSLLAEINYWAPRLRRTSEDT